LHILQQVVNVIFLSFLVLLFNKFFNLIKLIRLINTNGFLHIIPSGYHGSILDAGMLLKHCELQDEVSCRLIEFLSLQLLRTVLSQNSLKKEVKGFII